MTGIIAVGMESGLVLLIDLCLNYGNHEQLFSETLMFSCERNPAQLFNVAHDENNLGRIKEQLLRSSQSPPRHPVVPIGKLRCEKEHRGRKQMKISGIFLSQVI